MVENLKRFMTEWIFVNYSNSSLHNYFTHNFSRFGPLKIKITLTELRTAPQIWLNIIAQHRLTLNQVSWIWSYVFKCIFLAKFKLLRNFKSHYGKNSETVMTLWIFVRYFDFKGLWSWKNTHEIVVQQMMAAPGH